MSKIKSFRGKMSNDTIATLSLHTNNGSMGYRIVKFQIMANNFNVTDEYNVKIYKVPQTATTTVFDFADNTLVAAAYFENDAGVNGYDTTVIFDNEIFNQDIYITHQSQSGQAVNYYIELETVKLDLNENTVATLKDIRNITT